MGMRAGRMRHKITVYKSDGSRDDFGAPVAGAKTVVATPYCWVKPVANTETSGSQTRDNYTVQFGIRYSKTLENPTPEMYIEFKGSEYDIVSVINHDEMNEKLLITATRRR